MRKLNLRFVLPIAQFLLALSFLYWGTHEKTPSGSEELSVPSVTLICFGLNAPALFLRALGAWLGMPNIDHPPRVVFGFGLGEWLFLLGVIACWYLVGRWLDRHGSPKKQFKNEKFTIENLVVNLGVMALGLFLFRLAILARPGQFYSTGVVVEKALFLAWSAFLVLVPSFKLVHSFRKPVTPPST
jgi:hypothetical protein